MLNFRALCEGERIFYVDAKIANRALNLRMAEQNLHSAQVARLFIDYGRLGSTQGMRPVVLPAQPDPGNPTSRAYCRVLI
jgi:hypothetical protein